MGLKVWPGTPYPLGATYDGRGTNFSIFSEVAHRVQLCLFDAQGQETQIDLPETTAYCHHGYLPEVEPGQRYGFRVQGPWDPQKGVRCCAAKLLLDPYAKAIEGQVEWDRALFAYQPENLSGPPNDSDSAPFMPKCIVTNPFFDWSKDRPPAVTLHETVIYEAHVKDLTARHPEVPPEVRGTYAGVAHGAVIEHLTKLGVTAVELLPVHQYVQDNHLLEIGLRNHWGYNSIGYFAPHNEYCSGGQAGQQVREFKEMVLLLHQAGIEVILDVVYNHTAEGNHLGPMLCFKGIDNASYYRLMKDDPRHYMDYTGTGNSLNMRHPNVLQLVMDSLRYWVTQMHVDGFRFDLAATLARELHDVDRLSAFFDIIHQDPVLSQVKLIAEPWDVGEGGYQVGKFPPLWSEWNGRYRDSIRDYWRGEPELLGELAGRLTGSSDLYESNGRRPYASVNFITAHDGFCLEDLVSYEKKHNEANGEDNRDGTDDNRSWNCGAEGPTDDQDVLALRGRQKRNLLATLMLSQGIPLLRGGDEIGQTKRGNNNSYCQDSEVNYFDWEHADQALYDFCCRLVELRRDHPTFRRWKWFQGHSYRGAKDIGWYRNDASEMSADDWQTGYAKMLQVFLSGQLNSLDPHGQPVVDEDFLILFNASGEPAQFRIAPTGDGGKWCEVFDTAVGEWCDCKEGGSPGDTLELAAHSMVVLKHA